MFYACMQRRCLAVTHFRPLGRKFLFPYKRLSVSAITQLTLRFFARCNALKNRDTLSDSVPLAALLIDMIYRFRREKTENSEQEH